MFLIILTLLAALLLSGISAWISVLGLSVLFSGIYLQIIILATASEFGKIVAVTLLMRTWNTSSKILKCWLSFLILAGVLITSAGVYGLLSKGTAESTILVTQSEVVISGMNAAIVNLRDNITFIDDSTNNYRNELQNLQSQIDNYPKSYATKRIQVYDIQQPRRLAIDNALIDLRKQKVEILYKIKSINATKVAATIENSELTAEIAPLKNVAKALNIPEESAITIITILLMLILEPLAITLLIGANTLISTHIGKKDAGVGDLLSDLDVEAIPGEVVQIVEENNAEDELLVNLPLISIIPNDEVIEYISALSNDDTTGDIDKNLF